MTEVSRSLPRQMLAGAQMLFVAFGATVLVPILTGLDPAMTLLGVGIGTLLFQWITARKVPIFLGSSFAFIGAIILSIKTYGLAATLPAMAATSVMYFVLAIIVAKRGAAFVHKYVPPVVVGPVIMVIGLGLAAVAVNMAMGKSGDGAIEIVPYGTAMVVAAISLITTMLVATRAKGLMRVIPIMAGVVVGYLVSLALGLVDFTKVTQAVWLGVPAWPGWEFRWEAILVMLPVAIAPAIEHVGDILAVGNVTGKDFAEDPGLHRTLAGDGAAVLVAGLLGAPPVTTYSEVTGAVMLTRNYDPKIMTWAAVFAIILAFVAKLGAVLQTIPVPVMGGILLLLFGAIASVGMKTMIDAKVDLGAPRNLIIVSVTLVIGIGGLVVDGGGLSLKGVSLCGITAILLNLLLPREASAAPAAGK